MGETAKQQTTTNARLWRLRKRLLQMSIICSVASLLLTPIIFVVGALSFLVGAGAWITWTLLYYRDRIDPQLYDDDRGQAIEISRLLLSLVGGAVVYWVTDLATDPILSRAAAASNNATADTATGWFQTNVDLMPIGFAVIAFFGLIVVSIYQSERF